MNHVRAQRLAAGRDGPNVQVMNIRHTVGRHDRVFHRREVYVRRR